MPGNRAIGGFLPFWGVGWGQLHAAQSRHRSDHAASEDEALEAAEQAAGGQYTAPGDVAAVRCDVGSLDRLNRRGRRRPKALCLVRDSGISGSQDATRGHSAVSGEQ
jgi:hypothetical protein